MLSNFRLRLLLVLILWLITVVVLLTWVGGRQKVDLAFAGGPLGSEGYIVATAIAAELNAGDSNFRISVFETGGSSESKLLLETGQIDIASIQADTAVPEEVRSIARLFPDAYHLVVNTSAGIKHFSDLRGHRVAIPLAASAQNASFWFLADHYRIQAEDFQARPMAADAANFAMLEGQVDAVFRVRAPGNPRIRELIGANEMEIVPIEQAEALSLKQPALSPGNIPRGSYRGYPPLPKDNLPTAVLDRILVTRADLPASVIFQLTESIFEARSALVARSPLAGFISSLDADNSIPLHPGARQYYEREKPGVIQQNARLASALLYLLVLVGSGVIAVRSRWMRARNQRITDINERLMEIAEATRATENIQELSAYKNQLMDILREVVVDLDKNLVSQKEFEHFSFAWQAVDALVRDQMAIADRLELQLTQETAR